MKVDGKGAAGGTYW